MPFTGYVYVYSPFTAINLGQDCYCDCSPCGNCPHVAGRTGFCCPIDIGGSDYISQGTNVKFYASSYIGSIRTIRQTGFCTANPPAPYEDLVTVELYRYADAVCYIGKLFYGHLSNRVSDGVYNRTQYQGMTLGQVPGCCADCYGGLHTHIARDSQGESQSFSCYATLYGGSTWFYRWYWNDGWC